MRIIFSLTFICLGYAISAQVRPYAPEIFPENISSAVCGFSDNGKTIYFVQEDTVQKKLFLFEAAWNGTKWHNVKRLSFSGKYNDYGGRLTPDGKTFYFSSDRPGASDNVKDAWNLWKAERTTSGWKDPVPLRSISNDGDECCPTPMNNKIILFSATRGKAEWQILQPDQDSKYHGSVNVESAWQWPSYFDGTTKTLFFNSMKRPDSKGMDDIYMADFNEGKWSNIRNAGEIINTAEYEDGAILSPDRKLLIFCRHTTGNTPSKVLCIELESLGIFKHP